MSHPYIIIATYNALQWINKCLNSCKGFNVIVVDNNSKDGTVNVITNNFPEVKILPQNKNLGFGAANNIGISYALKQGADYVFLLNQDAYLKPKTINTLIEIHKKNTLFGILSPIHVNNAENELDRNFSYYISYDKNYNLLYDALVNKLKPVYEVPFVNAAAWLIPKNTLLTVGGFDPMFFHYGEDDNYCQRVLYHGLKIGIAPTTFIIHDRENKKTKPLKLFTDEYFKEKEKMYKVNWGNINNVNFEEEIKKTKKKFKTKIIRSLFKLNFNLVKYYKKELALINKIEGEIYQSRRVTKGKDNSFLN